MLSRKLLYNFILEDAHQLSLQDILVEAQLSAERRAEMMGWEGVELVYTSVIPTKNGDLTSYSFEIWGSGESLIPASDQQKNDITISTNRQVAKDIEI